jgi:hypothetical protein
VPTRPSRPRSECRPTPSSAGPFVTNCVNKRALADALPDHGTRVPPPRRWLTRPQLRQRIVVVKSSWRGGHTSPCAPYAVNHHRRLKVGPLVGGPPIGQPQVGRSRLDNPGGRARCLVSACAAWPRPAVTNAGESAQRHGRTGERPGSS